MTQQHEGPAPLVVEPLPARLVGEVDRRWVDRDGGAPLRCCLRDSRPGDRVALVAVAPEGPRGAYRETGPVFVHDGRCAGPEHDGYPDDFRRRAQVFRSYDRSGRIVGGEVVRAGRGQEEVAARLLSDPEVAFLQSRNLVHGCFMFTIRRPPDRADAAGARHG